MAQQIFFSPPIGWQRKVLIGQKWRERGGSGCPTVAWCFHLKERLALLKKEYEKTVYKLQRAQKAERMQKHIKKITAYQNQPQEEQRTTQLTMANARSSLLGTHWSSSSLKKCQAATDKSKETMSSNIMQEIIECPNESLISVHRSINSSAQPCTPSIEEMNPMTKTEGGVQNSVKLRKKRSCEMLKRVCEAANESDESLSANGEPCGKKMEALDKRDTHVSQTLGGPIKENAWHEALPQTEENTLLINGRQEMEDDCVIKHMSRVASDSAGRSMSKMEAFPSMAVEMLTEDAQLQEAKANCTEDHFKPELNLQKETVTLESAELQPVTTVCKLPGSSPLKSCTLVEGLIFPVEYYVRTTRRMTSSQRQVDLDAVIHSQLGKYRNGGKGRPKKFTPNQNSRVEGEAKMCDTLLLFNSLVGDGDESNPMTLQPDLQDSWNVAVDSQCTKSTLRKRRKRGREERTKFQIADAEQKSVESNSNAHGVQISLPSDAQDENESKKNEITTHQPAPNSSELYESSVNEMNSLNFSGTTNFNGINSSLMPNQAKQLLEPLKKSNVIQPNSVSTSPFKEDVNNLLTAPSELLLCGPEPSGTNSDIDSQELIPETQQDSFDGTSLKKKVNDTKKSFPFGINLDREKTESPVSQPKRKVKLLRGYNCRKTRRGSRRITEIFEDGTLMCSEPLLRVKIPIIRRLFHSQKVQDFDLPEEEYGQLKEKLRAEALNKFIPSQHDGVGCNLETRVERDNWDTPHCKSPHTTEIQQTAENFEESHQQKSSCCNELRRTPENPIDDICSRVQQISKTAYGHKLSPSILLSTPSCTPQATSCDPMFPSLGFTPASGSTECSLVSSQSKYRNLNLSQTGRQLHMLEGAGNCGQGFQTASEEVSQTDLNLPTPVEKEDGVCAFSGREYLNHKNEEDLKRKCETIVSEKEMPNDDSTKEFAELDTAIKEEKDNVLTPALASMQLEEKLGNQSLQLSSKIQNPSTSCIIDLCTVFWIVEETRTLCVACACETAVFLWAPQQLNQWTNIYTWAFDKVPIIELIPIPDAVNMLCVAFGSLEIREIKILHSTERGCLEHTLLQAGDINAVLGLAGRRLVCSCGTLQSQTIELNTLSKDGRSERSMQLIPPNEMVLAFSEVEGQMEALIGSTIMSNIVIWNLKTGHLLKRIHLSERYPGTICQKAYSQSGILFILLSCRYIGTCEGSVGGRICVLRMVGVNPMNGRSRPIRSYTLPVECSGRYVDGGVKGQSIAAIVTPGTLVLWDILSGRISSTLRHDPNGDWSLFYWAEEDWCLLARKNDSTVYVYTNA
ncbi:LOW QUALITY PROTEIN: partner and localizer of BRCA2 [Narcine bancroftii]|uniref:LOW QUALITY PROTEIN: partner and localizer of BRCA2 n=1 Tax=Narcine bancroftii TaxID=1343680 RepID=UPI0038310FC5